MLGLCCDETCGAMTNYDDGDDDGDNDGNGDDNAPSRSVSDGPIFNPITMTQSRGVESGNDGDDGDDAAVATYYVYMRRTIYLPFKDHIKDVP